ncbi:ATP-binding protein [Echinimonas agarilytica]|uniref:histidine kinase n=1 Tax=Echinimonas agarilytica TaxID=1215918 RepID=A0AA41W8N9_9GAMM|nr:ATP-binding protein [Echinimonas agarilytica]MCM2681064.1 ATP-binding protein [Echinimonas agarilytica]
MNQARLLQLSSVSPQRPLVVAVILGLLAAFTNLFTIPMLANTSLVLGGVFTMLAAILMRPQYALLATLIGVMGLLINWQHGWGFIWFPLEAIFVNWMVRHRVHALVADLIYWLLIGIPIVYFVLVSINNLSPPMLATILTKQVLNGYLYTLIASFFAMLPFVRRQLNADELSLPSLKVYLTQAFGMISTVCLLAYGLMTERNYTISVEEDVKRSLSYSSQQLSDNLDNSLDELKHSFATYATLLEVSPLTNPQPTLEAMLKANPELAAIQLLDKSAEPIYSARRTSFNRPLMSSSNMIAFSNESALEAVKKHEVTLSKVMLKPSVSLYPLISVSAPLYETDQFHAQGVLQGLIDLKTIETRHQQLFIDDEVDYLVLDSSGAALFSSRDIAFPPLKKVVYSPQEMATLPLPVEAITLNLPDGERDYFYHETTLDSGWKLIVLSRTSETLSTLQRHYLNWALFIVLASLVSVALGQLIANLFTRPLEELLSLSNYENPQQANTSPVAPHFHYVEQQQLFSTLARKSKALATYYNSLEQQVNARTHELQVLNDRLSRVLQASSDGILEVGSGGQVNFANQTLAGWLGQSARHLVGQSIDNLLRPVSGSMTLEQCVHEARFTRRIAQGEGLLKLGESLLELEFNAAPTLLEDGNVGAVVMLRNVTSRKEIQRNVDQARRSAEQAARAKSDFVANMSHEIRTPLNAIIGLIQLFGYDNLSQPQRQYLRRMAHGADLLQAIVNDILDYSKIEAGHLELDQQAFDISALLDNLRLLMSSRAEQKDLELECHVMDEVPIGVIGDPLRLSQIMMNLVSNAIKFTQRGSIKVSITALPDCDEDKAHLRFEVSDTGIGIPQDKLSSLFNPFTQADSATTRQYGGTGLGLAICQRLVKLMEGQLQVSSITDRGSKFWFDIQMPVAAPDQSLLQGPSSDTAPPNILFKQQHILVVEDNEVNSQIVQLMLGRLGLKASCASSGEQALATLKGEQGFDLVLMDLQMPDMDGIQTTEVIRTINRFNDLPVIALTAHATLADKKRCLQAGMQDHIGKPINMNELTRILARYLDYETTETDSEALITAPVESADVSSQPDPQPNAGDIAVFYQKYSHLSGHLGTLAEVGAWQDAKDLVGKALAACHAQELQAVRALLVSIRHELSDDQCSAKNLSELDKLLAEQA